jgi:hypothetical protein
VKLEASNVTLLWLSVAPVAEILSVVASPAQAPALKVSVPFPVKLMDGVLADPCALLVPNLAHLFATLPLVNFQPVLSALSAVNVEVAMLLPLHLPSLPPFPLQWSKVSLNTVLCAPPHSAHREKHQG